jgi:hypothetical protein
MKYMLLIYDDESAAPSEDSPEGQAEFGQWMKVSQELAESGDLVGGDALQPKATATTVRVTGGEPALTDGPFAETKEVLGGYYVLDVPDLDAAVAWAARMPHTARGGSVEVRPLMEFNAG